MEIGQWQIELTRPLWLAALLRLPLLAWFWRWTLVRCSPARRMVSLALRMVLVTLVTLALCGPKVTGPSKRRHVVMVVDCSPGVAKKSYDVLQSFADAAKQADREATVLWLADKEGGPETEKLRSENLHSVWLDRGKIGLATAISIAQASIPADRVGRILLFTNGNGKPTVVGERNIPIWTVPLPPPQDEVYLAAATAPSKIRRSEPFDLDAVVQSTHEDQGTLSVLRGSKTIASRKVDLVKGENRFRILLVLADGPAAMKGTVPFSSNENRDSPQVLTVRIDGCKDTIAENNALGCVVLVGPPPRVLLVESQPLLAAHLVKVLKQADIDVAVRPPREMPSRPEELARYDLLILSNVPAPALGAQRMAEIARYVKRGGGLIAVGGPQAFTAGEYRRTTLEDCLPVISEPGPPKPKPSLAMVLVMDVSGSMEGRSIDLAKEAIRRAVAMLTPRDQVGVLAFEDESHWIAPLAPVRDKEKIVAGIDKLVAGGGTTMYPAIDRAFLALREARADLKHIIVMTDGISNPGDFDGLARRVAAAGITMSTVGVGAEPARPLLQGIADRAGGHAYFCDDAAALPKIFAVETTIAAKIGITEEPFRPQVVHAAPALASLDFARGPRLLGYVETQPKPGAEVWLTARTGEPILACWHYGVGSAIAFTSDIQSRWAAAWLDWDGFGKFWVQLARQAMRAGPEPNDRFHAEFAGGRLHVTWDALDAKGNYLNGAQATLRLTCQRKGTVPFSSNENRDSPPKVRGRDIRLEQTAPGQYGAALETPAPGAYLLDAKLVDQGRLVDSERLGLVTPYADELRVRPVNAALLRDIAQKSGGRYDPTPAEALAPSGKTAQQTFWLWPWLLGAVLVGLVLDVAVKRKGG